MRLAKPFKRGNEPALIEILAANLDEEVVGHDLPIGVDRRQPVSQRRVDPSSGEGPPPDLIIDQLNAPAARFQDPRFASRCSSTARNGFRAKVAVDLCRSEHVEDLLADVVAEELREGTRPTWAGAPRGGFDDDAAVVVSYLKDGPGTAAEQEAAHAVDEAVDERLVERAERLAGGGLYRVALRAREDREELHEVPAAETGAPPSVPGRAAAREPSDPSRTIHATRRSNSARWMPWKSGTPQRCSQAGSTAMPSPASDIASSWWMSTGQQRSFTSTGSTQPALASSTSAMACSTPSVVSQKNVVFATCPRGGPSGPCAGGTS